MAIIKVIPFWVERLRGGSREYSDDSPYVLAMTVDGLVEGLSDRLAEAVDRVAEATLVRERATGPGRLGLPDPALAAEVLRTLGVGPHLEARLTQLRHADDIDSGRDTWDDVSEVSTVSRTGES